MHLLSFVALTGLVLLRAFAAARDPALDKAWNEWKKTHNKEYRERNAEDRRREIWEDNLRAIEEHNREASQGKHTFEMAMNAFGDLTQEEFQETLNGLSPELPKQREDKVTFFEKSDSRALPAFVDWRMNGYVTPVKNQNYPPTGCGSCWAFSAAGALEALNARWTGKLVDLSAQNLVDCSWGQGNQGCKGGWPSRAFEYVRANNGIDADYAYPYTAQEGACWYQPAYRAGTCNSYMTIRPNDEASLLQAVATIGPVSVAVDASSFQLYGSGIFNYPYCGTNLNHAVLVVGYGTENGVPYWIIKNSWGPQWGEAGYIRLLRGYNLCGVAMDASFPV